VNGYVYRKHAHVYEYVDRATHLFLVSKGLVSLRDIKPGDEELILRRVLNEVEREKL